MAIFKLGTNNFIWKPIIKQLLILVIAVLAADSSPFAQGFTPSYRWLGDIRVRSEADR